MNSTAVSEDREKVRPGVWIFCALMLLGAGGLVWMAFRPNKSTPNTAEQNAAFPEMSELDSTQAKVAPRAKSSVWLRR